MRFVEGLPIRQCASPVGISQESRILSKGGMSMKRASILTMAKVREVDQASLHCMRQEKVISLSCIAIHVICVVAPSCMEVKDE